MKIIDLLVKKANGEEIPKKIRYGSYIMIYDIYENDYRTSEQDYYDCDVKTYKWLFIDCIDIFADLNDEIEIIEEKPKKIEKLTHLDFADKVAVGNKINEIIDYLLEKESDK